MLLHVTSFFIFVPKKVLWCPHGAHPGGTPSRLSPLSPLFFYKRIHKRPFSTSHSCLLLSSCSPASRYFPHCPCPTAARSQTMVANYEMKWAYVSSHAT